MNIRLFVIVGIKMKMFETDHSWNWVDSNNRMVGFDNSQHCCEYASYDWLDREKEERDDIDLDDDPRFNFTGYFEYFNDGVVFEVTDGTFTRWLYIFNIQNGYYSHGFIFKDDDQVITEDRI